MIMYPFLMFNIRQNPFKVNILFIIRHSALFLRKFLYNFTNSLFISSQHVFHTSINMISHFLSGSFCISLLHCFVNCSVFFIGTFGVFSTVDWTPRDNPFHSSASICSIFFISSCTPDFIMERLVVIYKTTVIIVL